MKQDGPGSPAFSPILAKTPDFPTIAFPSPPKAPFLDRVPKGPKADSVPKGPSAGRLLATPVVDWHPADWVRATKNSGSIYNARQRSKRARALTCGMGPVPALMSAEAMSAELGQVGAGMNVMRAVGAPMQGSGGRSSTVRSMVKSAQGQAQFNHDKELSKLPKKRKLSQEISAYDLEKRSREEPEQELEEGEVKEKREEDFYAAEREEMNRKRDAHKSKRRTPEKETPAVTGKTWEQRARETMLTVKTKTWEQRAREASGGARM